MTGKKVIVVTGATGLQGGSVAKFLLEDGTFAVRAITRDVEKPKAKELVKKGAEVVQADFRDVESVKKAFSGAYGVFAVTNFWEPGVGYDGEVAQGKVLVDAAKAVGIQHFVWSTLESTEFKAVHWESKSVINDYLKASNVPRTSLYTSAYMDNFFADGYFPLKKAEDGSYSIFVPLISDLPFALYPTMDTGAYVLAIFKDPKKWISQDLKVASESLSPREIVKLMSEVSGKSVMLVEIDKEKFEELARTKQIPEEFVANSRVLHALASPPFREPAVCREVYPGITLFKPWLELHKKEVFGQ